MDNRRLVPLLLILVAGALLLFFALQAGDRWFGRGPNPETIVSSSLESMRAQQRLVPFVARFVSVTSSRQTRFGFTAERTLILPGDVRYELDLAKLGGQDLSWDAASRTLRVRLPDIEIAGPEVDLARAREYGSGGVLTTLTNAETQLDQANRTASVADLRKQAQAETPMRLAREAARQAVERSFALPLAAAGIDNVRVVARFRAEEGDRDPSQWDVSRPVDEVLEEARQRRAAGGN